MLLPGFIPAAEVLARYGLHPATFKRYAAQLISARRRGGEPHYSTWDIERWLSSGARELLLAVPEPPAPKRRPGFNRWGKPVQPPAAT